MRSGDIYIGGGRLRSAGYYGRIWMSRVGASANYPFHLDFDATIVNLRGNPSQYGFPLRCLSTVCDIRTIRSTFSRHSAYAKLSVARDDDGGACKSNSMLFQAVLP